jgi:hypothetical protein
MNPMAMLSSMAGNGAINPNQILKSLMGTTKGNPIDIIITSIVDMMYKNVPEKERESLFINDPRKSDKQKVVTTLIEKAAPAFVQNLSENDLSMLFDRIQAKKEK